MQQVSQVDAPATKDNLLGICHAIGEDLGFNPLFLRIPLAIALLWNPWVVLGSYAFMGVGVALSRLLFPKPRRATSAGQVPAALSVPAAAAGAEEGLVELAQAA